MGLFSFFKKEVSPEDIDYMSRAEAFEKEANYAGAIGEYENIIKYVYADKEAKYFRHITKKILECYRKLGDYEKVYEMWPQQYDSSDYSAKEMYELIKILESAQRADLMEKVYNQAGKSLAANRVEFLIKQKKIPDANALLTELLMSVPDNHPSAQKLWMTKAKLCLSLRKWEEAVKYLNKLLDKNPRNDEARKLKEFTIKQVRGA